MDRRNFHQSLAGLAAALVLPGARAQAAPRGTWEKRPVAAYPKGIQGETKHTRWARRAKDGLWYVNGGDYSQPGENPQALQSGSNNTWRVDLKTGRWEKLHPYWGKAGTVIPSHPDETVWAYDSKRDRFWHGGGYQWKPFSPGPNREESPIPPELQDRLLHGRWMSFDPEARAWEAHGGTKNAGTGKFGYYDAAGDRVLVPYFDGGSGNAVAAFDCARGEWKKIGVGGPDFTDLGENYAAHIATDGDQAGSLLFLARKTFAAFTLPLDKMRLTELATGARPPVRDSNTYGLAYHPGLRAYFLHGGRSGGQATNDLWALPAEGGDWQMVAMRGPAPNPRINQVLVYDPGLDALVAFGGTGGKPDNACWIARVEL